MAAQSDSPARPKTVAAALQHCFTELAQNGGPVLQYLQAASRLLHLPADSAVFHGGAACQHYLLVAAGRVRVYLIAPSGREVTLYHVSPGQSCVLTTSCLLGRSRYPATAVTVTEVSALAIPQPAFQQALNESEPFRRFVFANLADRLAMVIRRMEDIAFGDIDQRLARTLLAQSSDQTILPITHNELALRLGTAREVVSRHLKRFEQQGWLRLGRASVELLDHHALQQLSQD
jgi:CRP/FNR family transcriptional regulator